MAITLKYNQKTLDNVTLESVNTEAVYDDANESVMFNRTRIRATGTMQSTDSNPALADQINDRRKFFMTPRADLTVEIGNVKLFSITAPDDRDGPKPINVEFVDIVGHSFSIVRFEIEINQTECESAQPSNVASHTYQISHSYDERFLLTRTIRGRLVLRESANQNNPDALRGTVTPAPPQGMRRTRMNFAVSTDGQQLDYELTDEEVYITPPFPAVKVDGTFVHRLSSLAQWNNIIRVELEGHKRTPKIQLLELAYQIAASRMDFATELITDAQIEEGLYENRFSLQIITKVVALAGAGGSVTAIYPLISKMFNELPGEANPSAEALGPYGSALLGAAKAKFYDPCAGGSSSADPKGFTNSFDGPSVSTTVAPRSGSVTVQEDSNINSSQLEHPYEFWDERASYEFHNGIELMPSSRTDEPATLYQTHAPYAILKQRGAAVRRGQPAEPPLPISKDNDALRFSRIEPDTPQLAEDQQTFLYPVKWLFEILIPISSFSTSGDFVGVGGDFEVMPPANPTTTGSDDGPVNFQEAN